jgi:serine/threonine protein kinase
MLNQTVGNYRVVSLLGEGGMGVVYLAQHPGIGRKAAIKVLHPELARNPDPVTRFFNEARAANAIRHPGIVEVFDFGTLPDGATYITMEFLEGESLGARLKRVGRIGVGDAVELAYQTASALAAAHAAGIIHRDLKPDNLFLVPDEHTPGREVVKVLDFGIAKLSVEASGSGSVKTRTGTVMGTPIYMSPEQCRGTKEVDRRTDIYALGIILYEMICGQPPFVSSGHGELIHMHIAVEPASPRTHNPGVPVTLEKVVLRLLAKDAAERYQSMGDVQQALKASPARAGSTSEVDRLAPVPPTSGAPRSDPSVQTTFSTAASMVGDRVATGRRWGAPVLVGALVIAGVVGAAILGGRGRQATTTTHDTSAPAAPTAAAVAPPPTPEQPASISVSITSTPAGARLVRDKDGANIGVTPFKEAWPKGNGVEKLTLELDGYRPEPFAVPLERGVELTFPLIELPAKVPGAPVHKRRPGPSTPHGAPSAAPKPEPRSEPVPL